MPKYMELENVLFPMRQGQEILLLVTASRTALGPTQLPIPWVPGAPSSGVKRPGRKADLISI
jgi:hypothetical protein